MNLLSFLIPLKLYKAKTTMGTLIEVRELFGKKKMDLNGYPQSGSNYQKYWRYVFRMIKLDKLNRLGSGLVLGLGGGDLVKLLDLAQPNWDTTYVEIERQVIEIAIRFFGISETEKRKIVIQDAKLFMATNKHKYDLIIVDLYSGDEVPRFVSSDPFMRDIARAMNPMGMTIFNYASHSFRDNDFKSFENKLHKFFANVTVDKYIGHPFYLARM